MPGELLLYEMDIPREVRSRELYYFREHHPDRPVFVIECSTVRRTWGWLPIRYAPYRYLGTNVRYWFYSLISDIDDSDLDFVLREVFHGISPEDFFRRDNPDPTRTYAALRQARVVMPQITGWAGFHLLLALIVLFSIGYFFDASKMGRLAVQPLPVSPAPDGQLTSPTVPQHSPQLTAPQPPWKAPGSTPELVRPNQPDDLPPFFPWPPPRASAWDVVPNNLIYRDLQHPLTFAVLAERMERALDVAGYNHRAYYHVPDGFAMVTQVEKIEDDASSSAENRWQRISDQKTFSLSHYIYNLVNSKPGKYRVLVFVVTDIPFSLNGDSIGPAVAQEWVFGGRVFLPRGMQSTVYDVRHRTTALIYEFARPPKIDPYLVIPSSQTGREHLLKSGIWAALEPIGPAK